MKKVYIVDDEKLVRKGIISTFPWEKHGFTIVGDTGSGEKALEFIKCNDVDLLITDLIMPGMSGFELIKNVQTERPDINIAVLTCHDNFKYIQDAIRLGVIDYIVKTEIEDEVVEETLERISNKMESKNSSFYAGDIRKEDEALVGGILICGRRQDCDAMKLLNLGIKGITTRLLIPIDKQTWIVPNYGNINEVVSTDGFFPDLDNKDWVQVKITDIYTPMNEEVSNTLKSYRWKILFYSYDPMHSNYRFSMNDVQSFENNTNEEKRNDICARWEKINWIYSDKDFEQLLSRTKASGIDRNSLWRIFSNIAAEYDKLFRTNILQSLLESFDDLLFWYDWGIWICKFKEIIKERLMQNSSDEVTECIMKALEYIKKEEPFNLNESEIAKKVNMSRSYFSRCFKKVLGESFENYYKELRIEKARFMISVDDEPISVISEKCGFVDYRYFSRIFKEYTSMLPTDYRKRIRKKL